MNNRRFDDHRLRSVAVIDPERCCGCSQCRLSCPVAAIVAVGVHCQVEVDRCTRCGRCRWVCPVGCIGEDAGSV